MSVSSIPLRSSALSAVRSSRRVLLPVFVEELLAVGGDVPGIGPEAEIDAPPVVGHAAVDQLGDDLVEVEPALAERSVGARIVLIERAVGIDEMQMRYFAFQLVQ